MSPISSPVNRLKPVKTPAGAKPSGPKAHEGEPCKPGWSAARTGCTPKKKPEPKPRAPKGGGVTTPPGEKKPPVTRPGGEATKPPKKLPPRVAKPTVDDLHTEITGLIADPSGVSSTTPDTLAGRLGQLTVAGLNDLKKRLGVKVTGLKAVIVARITERALEAIAASRPKPPPPEVSPRPEPAKPEDEGLDLEEPVVLPPAEPEDEGLDLEEPPPPPKPEEVEDEGLDLEEPPPPPKPEEVEDEGLDLEEPPPHPPGKPPRPAEPGFTGTDSLGRRWVDGELQPGKEEPPVNRAYNPIYPLKVPRIKGIKLPVVPAQAMKDLHDAINPAYITSGGSVVPRARVDTSKLTGNSRSVLEKAGLIDSASGRVTSLGTMCHDLGVAGIDVADIAESMPPPTDRRSMRVWNAVYPELSPAKRARVISALGLKGMNPDADSREARKEITSALEASHADTVNGDVAASIRADRESVGLTDELGNLDLPSDEKIKELRGEIYTEYRSLVRSLGSLDRLRVGGKLPAAAEEKYEKLRGQISAAQKRHDEFDQEMSSATVARRNTLVDLLGIPAEKACRISTGKISGITDPTRASKAQKTHENAAAWLSAVVAKGAGGEGMEQYSLVYSDDRADYDGDLHQINVGKGVDEAIAVHEMVHGIEQKLPGVLAACRAFVEYRCHGEEPTKIAEKFPGHGYDPGETGRKDRFDAALSHTATAAYYAGKTYSNATEVLAMGVETLFRDPAEFARRDPEYCAFVIGILRGNVRFKDTR